MFTLTLRGREGLLLVIRLHSLLLAATLVVFHIPHALIQCVIVLVFFAVAARLIRNALHDSQKLQFNLPEHRQVLYPATRKIKVWLNVSSLFLFLFFAVLNFAIVVISGVPEGEPEWMFALGFYFGTMAALDLVGRYFAVT